MSQPTPTADDVLDAMRTAVAMFLAGAREDPDAIGVLWTSAPNKQLLLWHLCRMPRSLIAGAGTSAGRVLDVERALEGVARRLAEADPIDPSDPPTAA